MSEPHEITNTPAEKAPDTYFGFKLRTINEYVVPPLLCGFVLVLCLITIISNSVVIAAILASSALLYTLGFYKVQSLKSQRESLITEQASDHSKVLARIDALLWVLKDLLLPLSLALSTIFGIGIATGKPWRKILLGTVYGMALIGGLMYFKWLRVKYQKAR